MPKLYATAPKAGGLRKSWFKERTGVSGRDIILSLLAIGVVAEALCLRLGRFGGEGEGDEFGRLGLVWGVRDGPYKDGDARGKLMGGRSRGEPNGVVVGTANIVFPSI